MVGAYGVVTLLLANNTFFLPAMLALTFRRLILRIWKTGVDLLCSAVFAVAGLLYLLFGSIVAMVAVAGNMGGLWLDEFAVEHLHPMIIALLLFFAMTLVFFIRFYLYERSPLRTRRYFYRPSRVVARLRDAVESIRRPRFILLQ